MPTYEWIQAFGREFAAMDARMQKAFLRAVSLFVDDLGEGLSPRPGLRVKGVRGYPGVFEIMWAPDGRATFAYGEERIPGHPHIIWRRVGGHEILRRP